MLLEDELREVWKWPDSVSERLAVQLDKLRVVFPDSENEADHDYRVYRSLSRPSGYTKRCCRTAKLVEAHMIEALSSPHPYIRQWGRLIAKEKEDAGR